MSETIYEYELLSIEFEPPYEQLAFAREDAPGIEYDAEGIPMGNSEEEYAKRQQIIVDFMQRWGEEHPERKVRNDALDDCIYIKGISVIEAKEHSAKSYKSTRAILMLEEVLKDAKPVGRDSIKKGNSNQKEFQYMLIMVYRNPEVDTIKLTVGVRANAQRVQYGMTALHPGQPLIDKKKGKYEKTQTTYVNCVKSAPWNCVGPFTIHKEGEGSRAGTFALLEYNGIPTS